MLKLKEEINCLVSSVEFDEYVPFTVDFESDSLSPPLYWRVGDGKLSLMEVGLNKNSGAVHTITLTSIKAENVRMDNGYYVSCTSEKEGMPIFDLAEWKNGNCFDEFASYFIDELNLELELTLGQDFISVSIACGMDSVHCVKNNNVIFGINVEGNLINIDIINMSQEDIEIVSSASLG